jgi:spore germination cell wall hydrolase CwlJ-like protein
LTPSRNSLKLVILSALSYMVCFAPWQLGGVEKIAAVPVIPLRPGEIRPAPKTEPLPRASAGRNGPEAPSPAERPKVAAPRSTRPTAADIARQKARQRYLDNVYLLGKLIHAEARGEPYIGQVAVGAVVMNRLQSPLFPKSISGVIFEPGAFDAIIDGQFYLQPDTDAIRAAQDAIAGWDPTGGAIYYYNPAKTTSYWIWGRPVVMVIGQHYFAL